MPVNTEDRVSWVIPKTLRQAIAKVAAQHDRTISAEARQALAAWCRQHGVDPDVDQQ
jgi:plasmid stability protein